MKFLRLKCFPVLVCGFFAISGAEGVVLGRLVFFFHRGRPTRLIGLVGKLLVISINPTFGVSRIIEKEGNGKERTGNANKRDVGEREVEGRDVGRRGVNERDVGGGACTGKERKGTERKAKEREGKGK